MNYYFCRECGYKTISLNCPECGSANVESYGDIHLRSLGLDAYVGLMRAGDQVWLVVKKPSGQEQVELDPIDFTR